MCSVIGSNARNDSLLAAELAVAGGPGGEGRLGSPGPRERNRPQCDAATAGRFGVTARERGAAG